MMKVLIYSEYFLPTVGGVQTVVSLLARGLTGADLARADLSNSAGAKSIPSTGSPARDSPIEVTVVTGTPAGAMDDSALPYRVVRRPSFWRLLRLIRKADLMHLAGPCFLPMAIAWLIGKPMVIEHHGYQTICPSGSLLIEPQQNPCPGYFMEKKYAVCLRCCAGTKGWAGSIRAVLLTFPRRWLGRQAAVNIAISEHVAARLKMPRSRTIYHGVESAGDMALAGRWSTDDIHAAYLGRLASEKGVPVLIHAVRHLQEMGQPVKVSIVGDGPERARLEMLSKELGTDASVTFLGERRGRELDQALIGVEALVIPSVCEETFGLSAIEQMMQGRLVIAADIGGLSEVVGEAGLRFPAGDSRALAACLERLIKDRSLAASLGSAAYERATKLFRLDRMIDAHAAVYRELLAQ
jgi:glycosyltransferase involved in cell wall biosynthesis